MTPLYSLIIAQHPHPTPEPHDYRLGPLGIDWIDYHGEKEIPDDDGKRKAFGSSEDDNAGIPTAIPPPSEPPARRFTQGTTSLGPGIVHLFRHTSHPQRKETSPPAEGADGTLVAVLAVPVWMSFSDFGDWLGAWSTRLEGFRMIRDASPNKTLVLLKFEQHLAAQDFISVHTGTTFSRSPDRAEGCHPIRIHHLLLHDMSRLPSDAEEPPPPPALSRLLHPAEAVFELPTCPVCLERMDSVVTGLITTPCTHISNCRCLGRWDTPTSPTTTSCPVCQLSRRPHSHSPTQTPPPPPPPRCPRCPPSANPSNCNWACLICGYLGCSRYQSGHARDHYIRTGHGYAMELETQRVWDYKEDNYVHRLIQNRSDGMLVELPAATAVVSSRLASLSLDTPLGRPTPDETSVPRAEGRVSVQTEEKRAVQAQMEGIRAELVLARAEAGKGAEWRGMYEQEVERRRVLEETMEVLQNAIKQAEKKTGIASSLTSRLQQDLASEKALTTGLLAKIHALEDTVARLTQSKADALAQVAEMEETVRDLMMSISMGEKVRETGGEGGDVGVVKKKKGRR